MSIIAYSADLSGIDFDGNFSSAIEFRPRAMADAYWITPDASASRHWVCIDYSPFSVSSFFNFFDHIFSLPQPIFDFSKNIKTHSDKISVYTLSETYETRPHCVEWNWKLSSAFRSQQRKSPFSLNAIVFGISHVNKCKVSRMFMLNRCFFAIRHRISLVLGIHSCSKWRNAMVNRLQLCSL